MYFFKFIKWWWLDYLNDNITRAGILAIFWAVGMFITIILSTIFTNSLIAGLYLAISLLLLLLYTITSLFLFMRNLYYQWQQQVVDKLKGL